MTQHLPEQVTYTLEELAQRTQGRFVGDGQLVITDIKHPLQVRQVSEMGLILDAKIVHRLGELPLQTALVPEGVEAPIPNQLIVSRPKVALSVLLDLYHPPLHIQTGPDSLIHPTAVVHPTARLGDNVQIGPYCCVGPNTLLSDNVTLVSHVNIGGECHISNNSLFHSGVKIGDRVQIGKHVIIQANAVIGSDGFSYVTKELGSVESARSSASQSASIGATNDDILRINSVGTVVIEDKVEIGANTTIDRATLGETRIKQGTKIDNQVQVAHNVVIGKNCLVAAQVGISGSVTVEDGVVIAGQAGVRDHTTIGENSIIMAQCGVTTDIPEKTILLGSPGVPRDDFIRQQMHLKSIKSVKRNIKELVQRLDALEASQHVTEPVQETTPV